jgi:hypothetical protein
MAESSALLIAVVALVAVIGILGLLALNAATTASTSVLASMGEKPVPSSGPEKPAPTGPEKPAPTGPEQPEVCKYYCWKAVGNNVVTINLCHIPDEQRGTVADNLEEHAGFNCPFTYTLTCPTAPSKEACIGKPSCTWTFNNQVCGDTCFGYVKTGYLTVECVNPTTGQTDVACCSAQEGSCCTATCPSGEVVQSVKYVKYGAAGCGNLGACNSPEGADCKAPS